MERNNYQSHWLKGSRKWSYSHCFFVIISIIVDSIITLNLCYKLTELWLKSGWSHVLLTRQQQCSTVHATQHTCKDEWPGYRRPIDAWHALIELTDSLGSHAELCPARCTDTHAHTHTHTHYAFIFLPHDALHLHASSVYANITAKKRNRRALRRVVNATYRGRSEGLGSYWP